MHADLGRQKIGPRVSQPEGEYARRGAIFTQKWKLWTKNGPGRPFGTRSRSHGKSFRGPGAKVFSRYGFSRPALQPDRAPSHDKGWRRLTRKRGHALGTCQRFPL